MREGIDRIFCRCGGKGSAGGLFGGHCLFPAARRAFFSGLCAGEASRWGGGPSLPSAALDVPFSGKGRRTDAACRGDGGRAAGGFLAPSFGGETRNKRLSPAQETLFAGGGVGRTVPLWGGGDRRCGKVALWRAARPGGDFLFLAGKGGPARGGPGPGGGGISMGKSFAGGGCRSCRGQWGGADARQRGRRPSAGAEIPTRSPATRAAGADG